LERGWKEGGKENEKKHEILEKKDSSKRLKGEGGDKEGNHEQQGKCGMTYK